MLDALFVLAGLGVLVLAAVIQNELIDMSTGDKLLFSDSLGVTHLNPSEKMQKH